MSALRAWVSANRTETAFALAVVIGYAALTIVGLAVVGHSPDRMMVLAQRIFEGRLDDPSFKGTVDSVTIGDRSYVAVGPLQVVPYLVFVPFPALYPVAAAVIGAVIGAAAAGLSLPLVRAYGAPAGRDIWLAAFVAFGTLLLFASVEADMYYLAQVESFLLLELFLLEWAAKGRPLLLGVAIGLSFLARPTTVLAVIPFGGVLLWRSRRRIGDALAMAFPVGVAIGAYGLFNAARFGSPFQSGYAISQLHSSLLSTRRAAGLFSVGHIRENLRLAFLTLPRLVPRAPYVLPSVYGMSMLLVSPGLVIALRAGFRGLDRLVLWTAAILVTFPIFLYYGGGVVQYGFRYSLDATPFLVALIAIGLRGGFGWIERGLFVFSAVSVVFGSLWRAGVFGHP